MQTPATPQPANVPTSTPTTPATPPPAAQPKRGYEASPEVQRWIQRQGPREDERTLPPFAPTFLAGQRDRDWVLSSLEHFYEQGYIRDVLRVVQSGKEATVYCCAATPATGRDYVAAKVYRPRMFRSLRNDAIYRESREMRDAVGQQIRGSRRTRWAASKTARRREARVGEWISFEFETQRLLAAAGADVPRPLATMGNAVLMEYIGAPDEPAPRLREVALDREEAGQLFARILRNVELWLACDRIHGDLSAYNILYWQGAVIIIDFAQAVDPRYHGAVYPLLERDIARVCQHFARFGVEADAPALAGELWARYLRRAL